MRRAASTSRTCGRWVVGLRPIPRIDAYEPLSLELQDFSSAIRTGSMPRSNSALGLEIVSVLEAADASLRRNGAPIAVGSAARARVAA